MLREIAADLDPLKLLEEMRAVQAYLAALANGETPPPTTADPPDLAAFVAGLSSAWHAGEIRPTFSIEAKPRYLRSLQNPSKQTTSSIVGARTSDPATSGGDVRENAGKAEASIRRARSSPYSGAPHGLADRMPPFRGIPQHQRHAAFRGAVRPISRPIYPQAV